MREGLLAGVASKGQILDTSTSAGAGCAGGGQMGTGIYHLTTLKYIYRDT